MTGILLASIVGFCAGVGARDDVRSGPISDLAAAPAGETSFTLTWTSVGGYQQIFASAVGPITEQMLDGDPALLYVIDNPTAPPGVREMLPLDRLVDVFYNPVPIVTGQLYWFAIYSSNTSGEGLSNCPSCIPRDVSPPARVDLQSSVPTFSSVVLRWTAPGDDGMTGRAVAYDLRMSTTGTIDDETAFEAAIPVAGIPEPATAGTIQQFTVQGLRPGRSHHFSLRAIDDTSNWSPLATSLEVITQADTSPPSTVRDLCVTSADALTIQLGWTAPSDNDTVDRYDVRSSAVGPILTDADFASAAPMAFAVVAPGTAVVEGLQQYSSYWFALRSADRNPNWSAISNSVEVRTQPGGSFDGSSTCAVSARGGAGSQVSVFAFLIFLLRRRAFSD